MTVAAPPNPLISATPRATASASGCSGCRPIATGPTCCAPSVGPSGPTTSVLVHRGALLSTRPSSCSRLDEIFATKSVGRVGADLRPGGRLVGTGAARPRDRRRPAGPRGRRLRDVPTDDGDAVEMVASPVDFGGTPWAPRSMPPEFAQHTEEVLLELGYDWDRIIELKEPGAVRSHMASTMYKRVAVGIVEREHRRHAGQRMTSGSTSTPWRRGACGRHRRPRW